MTKKKMFARSRRTGVPIVGTLERMEGQSDTVTDQWGRNAAGDLEYEHHGFTQVFWHGQKTVKDEYGKTVFVDEKGNHVAAADVELHHEGEPFVAPGNIEDSVNETAEDAGAGKSGCAAGA